MNNYNKTEEVLTPSYYEHDYKRPRSTIFKFFLYSFYILTIVVFLIFTFVIVTKFQKIKTKFNNITDGLFSESPTQPIAEIVEETPFEIATNIFLKTDADLKESKTPKINLHYYVLYRFLSIFVCSLLTILLANLIKLNYAKNFIQLIINGTISFLIQTILGGYNMISGFYLHYIETKQNINPYNHLLLGVLLSLVIAPLLLVMIRIQIKMTFLSLNHFSKLTEMIYYSQKNINALSKPSVLPFSLFVDPLNVQVIIFVFMLSYSILDKIICNFVLTEYMISMMDYAKDLKLVRIFGNLSEFSYFSDLLTAPFIIIKCIALNSDELKIEDLSNAVTDLLLYIIPSWIFMVHVYNLGVVCFKNTENYETFELSVTNMLERYDFICSSIKEFTYGGGAIKVVKNYFYIKNGLIIFSLLLKGVLYSFDNAINKFELNMNSNVLQFINLIQDIEKLLEIEKKSVIKSILEIYLTQFLLNLFFDPLTLLAIAKIVPLASSILIAIIIKSSYLILELSRNILKFRILADTNHIKDTALGYLI